MSMGLIALICGILGIAGGAIPVVQYFTFVLSIIAIVLGFKTIKYPEQKGFATAGIILGFIGALITVVYVLLVGLLVSSMGVAMFSVLF